MADITRTRSIRVALKEEERMLFHKLAHAREQTIAQMLRDLVKAEAARCGVNMTTKREKR